MGRVQRQQQAHRTSAAGTYHGACSDRQHSPRRWRRLAARIALACTFLCMAGAALAQQPAVPPGSAPTAPAAPSTTPIGRDMTLEYVIVLAMFGLALFAVCRSTRRN